MSLQTDVGWKTASAQVCFRPIFQQQVFELQPTGSTGSPKKRKCDTQKIQSVTFQFFLNGVTPIQMLSMASFPCGCTMDSGCAPSGVSLKQKDFYREFIGRKKFSWLPRKKKNLSRMVLRFCKAPSAHHRGEESRGGGAAPYKHPEALNAPPCLLRDHCSLK